MERIEPLLLKLKDGTGKIPLGPLVPDSKPSETIDQLKSQFLPHCHKVEITETLTSKLQHCLDFCVARLDSLNEEIEALTIEVLRGLRWCATDDTAAFNMTMSNLVLVIDRLMVKAVGLGFNDKLVVKVAIQVLLNMLSGSDEKRKQTRKAKIQNDIVIDNYINLSQHCYEVSALLYNLDLNHSAGVLNYTLENYTKNPNEYLEMLMGKIVENQSLWLKYPTLPSSYKIDILNFLLSNQEDNLPPECLDCLSDFFSSSGDVVFQVSNCTNSVIEEVALTLEVLAHLSSKEKCLSHLSGNKNLLINGGVLLINAHRLGKTSDSVFKPVQKMQDLQNPENLHSNPVFGFKAHLIKLIGNLCWKNRVIQDLVREAELIPVLLDCCNVDANNPFIMQWAIFAIRNLCEGNQDNQKIIAGMTRKQFVSNEVLEEFGLTLHTENGSSTGLLFLEKN